jgi:hypothetical protein
MAKQTKEVAVQKPNAPMIYGEMDSSLLDMLPQAESNDIEIPRLTMVQPTSKLEGNPGDVIDSTTNTKVISAGEKLKFVAIWFFKDYAISEVDDKGREKKWLRNEPKSDANAMYSLMDNRFGEENGVSVTRKERLNLFVVRESDLAGDDLPRVYRIVLKPSSFKEAKKFLTEWDIQRRSRLVPFSYFWSVTPKVISNDKGKFAIYEFAKEMQDGKQRQVTQEQFQAVQFWVKTLSQNKETVMRQEVREEIETPVEDAQFETGKLNY